MSKSNEDDLREVLDEPRWKSQKCTRRPRTWQSWMVYLLERLEAQAIQNPAYIESFKEMVVSLQDD